MISELKQFFDKFSVMKADELKLIVTFAKIKSVKKGERIVELGESNKCVFIVIKGLLRTFTYTENSEERTVLFTTNGNAVGSYLSILRNKPSNECIEAIENSVLIVLDSVKLDELAKNRPNLIKAQNNALKKNLAEAVERIHFYTLYSPEERYVHFKNENPNLINRIPQKYLASYLGMTTVSLSRIKSRTK